MVGQGRPMVTLDPDAWADLVTAVTALQEGCNEEAEGISVALMKCQRSATLSPVHRMSLAEKDHATPRSRRSSFAHQTCSVDDSGGSLSNAPSEMSSASAHQGFRLLLGLQAEEQYNRSVIFQELEHERMEFADDVVLALIQMAERHAEVVALNEAKVRWMEIRQAELMVRAEIVLEERRLSPQWATAVSTHLLDEQYNLALEETYGRLQIAAEAECNRQLIGHTVYMESQFAAEIQELIATEFESRDLLMDVETAVLSNLFAEQQIMLAALQLHQTQMEMSNSGPSEDRWTELLQEEAHWRNVIVVDEVEQKTQLAEVRGFLEDAHTHMMKKLFTSQKCTLALEEANARLLVTNEEESDWQTLRQAWYMEDRVTSGLLGLISLEAANRELISILEAAMASRLQDQECNQRALFHCHVQPKGLDALLEEESTARWQLDQFESLERISLENEELRESLPRFVMDDIDALLQHMFALTAAESSERLETTTVEKYYWQSLLHYFSTVLEKAEQEAASGHHLEQDCMPLADEEVGKEAVNAHQADDEEEEEEEDFQLPEQTPSVEERFATKLQAARGHHLEQDCMPLADEEVGKEAVDAQQAEEEEEDFQLPEQTPSVEEHFATKLQDIVASEVASRDLLLTIEAAVALSLYQQNEMALAIMGMKGMAVGQSVSHQLLEDDLLAKVMQEEAVEREQLMLDEMRNEEQLELAKYVVDDAHGRTMMLALMAQQQAVALEEMTGRMGIVSEEECTRQWVGQFSYLEERFTSDVQAVMLSEANAREQISLIESAIFANLQEREEITWVILLMNRESRGLLHLDELLAEELQARQQMAQDEAFNWVDIVNEELRCSLQRFVFENTALLAQQQYSLALAELSGRLDIMTAQHYDLQAIQQAIHMDIRLERQAQSELTSWLVQQQCSLAMVETAGRMEAMTLERCEWQSLRQAIHLDTLVQATIQDRETKAAIQQDAVHSTQQNAIVMQEADTRLDVIIEEDIAWRTFLQAVEYERTMFSKLEDLMASEAFLRDLLISSEMTLTTTLFGHEIAVRYIYQIQNSAVSPEAEARIQIEDAETIEWAAIVKEDLNQSVQRLAVDSVALATQQQQSLEMLETAQRLQMTTTESSAWHALSRDICLRILALQPALHAVLPFLITVLSTEYSEELYTVHAMLMMCSQPMKCLNVDCLFSAELQARQLVEESQASGWAAAINEDLRQALEIKMSQGQAMYRDLLHAIMSTEMAIRIEITVSEECTWQALLQAIHSEACYAMQLQDITAAEQISRESLLSVESDVWASFMEQEKRLLDAINVDSRLVRFVEEHAHLCDAQLADLKRYVQKCFVYVSSTTHPAEVPCKPNISTKLADQCPAARPEPILKSFPPALPAHWSSVQPCNWQPRPQSARSLYQPPQPLPAVYGIAARSLEDREIEKRAQLHRDQEAAWQFLLWQMKRPFAIEVRLELNRLPQASQVNPPGKLWLPDDSPVSNLAVLCVGNPAALGRMAAIRQRRSWDDDTMELPSGSSSMNGPKGLLRLSSPRSRKNSAPLRPASAPVYSINDALPRPKEYSAQFIRAKRLSNTRLEK